MPYQVHGGLTKDAEYEKYEEALEELGLPLDRDAQGRIGVVDDRETAEQILEKMRAKVRHLPWEIREVTA